jgi:hypothetical protein
MREKKIKTGVAICGIDEILFPVEFRINPRKTNKEYSRVVTGILDGEEWDLNYCSNIYTLIKNEDIFPNIEAILDAKCIEYEVTYQHINHVRFYADYRITDSRYGYTMKGTSDTIMPMLRVQHSYNGLTKYKIIFGYFRLVCSNGATVPVAEMNNFNLVIGGKHTLAIEKSFKDLDTLLVRFTNEGEIICGAITIKYEVLGSRWVAKPEDRLKEVLEACKITVVENSKFNTLNDILGRIRAEADGKSTFDMGYKGRVNDWLIYNGINQYLNDNSRNIMTPEVRMEKDSKVIEYMLENA